MEEGRVTLLSVFSVSSRDARSQARGGSHPLHGSLYVGVCGGEVKAEVQGTAEQHAAIKDGRESFFLNQLCGLTETFYLSENQNPKI